MLAINENDHAPDEPVAGDVIGVDIGAADLAVVGCAAREQFGAHCPEGEEVVEVAEVEAVFVFGGVVGLLLSVNSGHGGSNIRP